MFILVGLLATGLGAALRFGEVGSAAGVNTHQVGATLLLAGGLELALALLLHFKSETRELRPVRVEGTAPTAGEHREDRAA